MEKNIHTKLLEFQKLGITIIKDGKNEYFKNKAGSPSKYCTLNEVLDKVKKPLNDIGVVIIFEPQLEGLKTILYDTESKTEISSFMKYVDCSNAQKLLACNTYYRRGSLVSLLGLEDEDDDGNKASEKTPKVDDNQEWIDEINKCKTVSELEAFWKSNQLVLKSNKAMIALVTKTKDKLNAKN